MTLNKDSIIGRLLAILPQQGVITWIGVRPERRAPVISVSETEAIVSRGLAGDHYHGKALSTRQVTLIQAEHLVAVASFLHMETLDPAWMRRNIVVSGINLLALKDKRFYAGNVLPEMSGLCHPCSRKY